MRNTTVYQDESIGKEEFTPTKIMSVAIQLQGKQRSNKEQKQRDMREEPLPSIKKKGQPNVSKEMVDSEFDSATESSESQISNRLQNQTNNDF